MKHKAKIILKKIVLGLVLVSTLVGTIAPMVVHAAPGQTTIIMLDKTGPYDIGEKVKVTVGISSTDGAYLKEAYCGFGYNGATMKLLTETETEDHFRVRSAAPSKWLYYDLEFEMLTNGTMFFIAGAYSGSGVISAIKADGNHISLPRASVLYKIGTGQYTKVSDCNLDTLKVSDQDGSEIAFNRNFDKNITSYSAELDASVKYLQITATAENPNDEVILPDLNINTGDSEKIIQVKATDGTIKKYILRFHKPAEMAECENILIKDANGKTISGEFNPEVMRYDITVPNKNGKISYEVIVANGSTSHEMVEGEDLEVGYNIKKIRLYTDSDSKTYEYFIYREPSALTLTSLVAEGSDELTLTFNQEFKPDINEYTAEVTSDVRKVKLIYTLANPEDYVKEEVDEIELQHGENIIDVTVTDGINENIYRIRINRPEYEKIFVEEQEDPGTYRNPHEFTYFKKRNLTILLAVGAIVFIGFTIANAVKTKKAGDEYKKSEDAEIDKLIEDRKKRLKKMEKERKKNK